MFSLFLGCKLNFAAVREMQYAREFLNPVEQL